MRGGIVSPRWLWMPDEGENEGNGEGGESPLEEVSPAAPQRNGVITWARGNSERPLSTLFSFSVKENKVEKCSRNGFWGGLSSPVPPRSLARPDNTSQEVSGGCRTCRTLAMDNIKHARRENHAIVDRKTVSHDVRLGTGGALTRRPNATNGTWLMGGTAGVQEQQGAGGALMNSLIDRQRLLKRKELRRNCPPICVCVCREGPSSTTHQTSFSVSCNWKPCFL